MQSNGNRVIAWHPAAAGAGGVREDLPHAAPIFSKIPTKLHLQRHPRPRTR